jgi:glycosidase
VAAQRDDPDSTLHLVRDLITLRRSVGDLQVGDYRTLPSPPGSWAWSRGERIVVLASLSDGGAGVDGVIGTVVASTDRSRRGERVDGTLRVGGWEAVVVDRGVRPEV